MKRQPAANTRGAVAGGGRRLWLIPSLSNINRAVLTNCLLSGLISPANRSSCCSRRCLGAEWNTGPRGEKGFTCSRTSAGGGARANGKRLMPFAYPISDVMFPISSLSRSHSSRLLNAATDLDGCPAGTLPAMWPPPPFGADENRAESTKREQGQRTDRSSLSDCKILRHLRPLVTRGRWKVQFVALVGEGATPSVRAQDRQ